MDAVRRGCAACSDALCCGGCVIDDGRWCCPHDSSSMEVLRNDVRIGVRWSTCADVLAVDCGWVAGCVECCMAACSVLNISSYSPTLTCRALTCALSAVRETWDLMDSTL